MRLESLELIGFKSFARSKTFLFSSQITAIVGPNGSGKSNVAEAFRWVLGEQSMKSLRGKRGEDLIFNGAGSSSGSGRASVTVTFDNRDKSLAYDFDKVIITRTIYKDGTNEYKLNGSKVRLKDILEILASASLGSSGHHIISQGEADRILNSSLKDRREMIEDALGLKVYQWKIEEAEKKLSKTENNIREVELLRREISPHLKFLEREVKKIEESDKLRYELKLLYMEYFFREEEYLKKKKEEIKDKLKRPTEELLEVRSKIIQLGEKLMAPSSKLRVFEDEIERIDKNIEKLEREKDDFSRSIGRLEGVLEAKKDLTLKSVKHKSIPWHEVKDVSEEVESTIRRMDDIDFKEVKNILTNILDKLKELVYEDKNQLSENDLSFETDKIKEERQTLLEKQAEIESKIAQAKEEKNQSVVALENTRKDMQDSERLRYELRAKKGELEAVINNLKSLENKNYYEEEEFKKEKDQAISLVGVEVGDYRRILKEVDNLDEVRENQLTRRKDIERFKIKLEDSGSPNMDVIEEYKETVKRDEYLTSELTDLTESVESLNKIREELSEKIAREFKEGLVKINKEFSSYFSLMFGGGSATLVLVSEPDRKEEGKEIEGIDIKLNIPRKNIKTLDMMSGGERALTSIALLFAMSQVNPPPFLILDETDAALDEANSRKYGDMIERLSKESQLILITHNRETMSRAGVIYGVTMGREGISSLLSIKLEEAEEWAK